jgi:DNA-binding response OmpR family regulator
MEDQNFTPPVRLCDALERLFLALASGRRRSFTDCIEALGCVEPEEGSDPRATLRVQICRLRKAIAPHGLILDCIRGYGYVLSAAEAQPATQKAAA